MKKNEKQKIFDRAKKEAYKDISALLNEQAAAINQYQFKISAALQVLGDFAEKSESDEAEKLLYQLSEILLVRTIDPLLLNSDKIRNLKTKFEQKLAIKNYSSQE